MAATPQPARRQVRSLAFEGEDVERLRVSLQATNFICDRPLRHGDRVRIVVEAEVSRIEFGGTPLVRKHILVPTEADLIDENPAV